MPSEEIQDALLKVMDAMIDSYEEERKQDPEWKSLFKKLDGNNFKSLLRGATDKMEVIALDTYGMIEQQLDIKDPKSRHEIYDLVYALPYIVNHLTKHVKSEEGLGCSVDKVYYVLNSYINKVNDTDRDNK